MDPKKQKRKFTHLSIPAGLWLYRGLSIVEKALIAEVDSISSPLCYASNQYFQAFFGLKRRQTSGLINGLVKKGWLTSQIDPAAGNKRILRLTPKAEELKLKDSAVVLSRKTAIGYSEKLPEGMAMQGGEGIAKNCHSPYKEENKTNTKDEIKEKNKATVEKSSSDILELDLLIVEQRNLFMREIANIFPYLTRREVNTFANITRYLVEQVQQCKLEIGIFKDAIEWARIAAASTAKSTKAVFVAKIKKETGFKAQEKLL